MKILCSRCYLRTEVESLGCCVRCTDKKRVDQEHWDCAEKFAFNRGWIPNLRSPFSLAVPDPLDRFRIQELVLFKRVETGWLEVGFVGSIYEQDGLFHVEQCVHSPWANECFVELQYPILNKLVEKLTPRQIQDYWDCVRASQSESIHSYARSIAPPPKVPDADALEIACNINAPPTLASWKP